jgi:hypothetical protein
MIVHKMQDKISSALEAVKDLRDKLRNNTITESEKRLLLHGAINNLFSVHHSMNRLIEFFDNLKIHLEDLKDE